MAILGTRDFNVDLANRTATHASGAIISFYEYETNDDWLAADSLQVRNSDLYRGSSQELGRAAKAAALAAGMTHQKP